MVKEAGQNKRKEILDGLFYNFFLIEQKLKEWRSIWNKAKDDLGIKHTQLIDIHKKSEEICDVIFHMHGRSKYADELVSKIYYNYLDKIKTIEKYYNMTELNRAGNISEFIRRPIIKQITEQLPFDEYFNLEKKVKYILNETRHHEIATEFVAKTLGLSEERIRKKIKKIYQ